MEIYYLLWTELYVSLSSPFSYVETLAPNVILFGEGAFGN
jgi:hypothetical protein